MLSSKYCKMTKNYLKISYIREYRKSYNHKGTISTQMSINHSYLILILTLQIMSQNKSYRTLFSNKTSQRELIGLIEE